MVSIVGDSLVIGKYATGPDKRNRNLILAALRKEHSVTPLEASPSEVTGLATKVSVPAHLDLVILELGTDDSRRLSPATFASDFDALVASVRRTSASAALVCTGLWSATGGAYDAVIERACRGAGGRFVSLRAMYDVPANRGPAKISGYYGVSDATYPNDAGHRAIAKAVLAALGVALR